MAKILILMSAHLCMSPRSQKEAETLANAGHDVTIQGVWFDLELAKRDRLLTLNKKWNFKPFLDFRPVNRLSNIAVRLENRIAKEQFKQFGLFSPQVLGYGVKAMLKTARCTRADLTIVHSEAGLWVGDRLLSEGFQIGVDFEDWFSEDLLPEARATRPIQQLKQLEQRLIQNCRYCLTTSQAMATALSNAYQAPQPTVVYNSFSWSERDDLDHQKRDRRNLNIPSLHWFSQTIGQGRGLELLFQALPYLKTTVEIHLRGHYSASIQQWLELQIPDEWRDRIFIHSTVTNDELLSRIAEHDIGLALEQSAIVNRNLTITNKFFQYLQAGLAVIATDTAGQKEIFEQHPTIGRLIPQNEPQALAGAIDDVLETPERLKAAKMAALQITQEKFCWENQSATLLRAIKTVNWFSNPK